MGEGAGAVSCACATKRTRDRTKAPKPQRNEPLGIRGMILLLTPYNSRRTDLTCRSVSLNRRFILSASVLRRYNIPRRGTAMFGLLNHPRGLSSDLPDHIR